MSEDHKAQSLRTAIGQQVTVDRRKVTDEDSRTAAGLIAQAGGLCNDAPEIYRYIGSMAIHLYYNETFGELSFASQLPLGTASEKFADLAIQSLRSDAMVAYSRKRQTKRSGF